MKSRKFWSLLGEQAGYFVMESLTAKAPAILEMLFDMIEKQSNFGKLMMKSFVAKTHNCYLPC